MPGEKTNVALRNYKVTVIKKIKIITQYRDFSSEFPPQTQTRGKAFDHSDGRFSG
jgi:hypothetical protein